MVEDYGTVIAVGGVVLIGVFMLQRLIKLALVLAGVGVLAFAAYSAGLF